ncbi:hypothetical protein [Bacillus infantis]|uniref:Flp family type IVb pilin n=1 Tax=Bacillus infantis TaxID=324767 RepID=A0A5D4S6T2_9BACI|nr:hypothetical protein [Bacillus infantis]MCP1156482.1 hypothetical protein [Bacillus infantis]TYS57928.1 hypothetical protein FZD47_24130 [Bacillus infantis]
MKTMLTKMNNCVIGLYVNAKSKVQNEAGVSTIEWVGLAAVVVALMFAVAGAMSGQGSGLAGAIVGKISDMIESIGN